MNELEAHKHLSLVVDTIASLPQADAPVEHFLSNNVYIRQVFLKKGTVAVGHEQKFHHVNVVISGKVAIFCDNGTIKLVEAPLIFTGNPGRKFGFVIEDTVWLNVYATNGEKDIEKLEDKFLNKSLLPEIHLPEVNIEAQKDFESLSFGAPQSCLINFRELDMVSQSKITFRPSGIHGYGMFLTSPVPSGSAIIPVAIGDEKTIALKFLNHSNKPNCNVRCFGYSHWLVSLQPINGCVGGNYGTELTIDYREVSKEVLECLL